MTKKSKNERADLYTRITDKIVADLEQGVRPWMKPWANATASDGISRPLRYNGEPYSGLNVLLLWSAASARGYASPTWMTFRQPVELGGAVRKGETGATVIYASRFTKREADGHGGEVERAIPFLKSYTVFNVAQIDGLPDRYLGADKPVAEPAERIAHADQFFRNTGADIHHGGNQAFYSPGSDFIQMPAFESFKDPQAYVGTLSHECVHWTAHPDRVGRDLSRYSSDRSERAREELNLAVASCVPISASFRNWSRDQITLLICSRGCACCRTTSALSSRLRHMRSALWAFFMICRGQQRLGPRRLEANRTISDGRRPRRRSSPRPGLVRLCCQHSA